MAVGVAQVRSGVVTCTTPEPTMVTNWGLAGALLRICSVPAGCAPSAVGVKVRPMVQLAPAASVPGFGHVVDGATAYSLPAMIAMALILSAEA